MPTQVQLRRGTTSQNDAFTGAEGEVSVDTTVDTLRVHDGSTAGGHRLAKYSELNTGDITAVVAGTGLSGGATSGSATVNLSHLGIESLADPNADRIAFWDDSAGATQWLTVGTNLTLSGTTLSADAQGDIEGVTAGDGLSGGGTSGTVTVALDLNELTAATVDVANDSIAIIDAGDSSSKKESISDLVAGIAGTGLSESSGTLVVGTLNQDTTGNAATFTASANNSTDETVYPIFVDGATGSQGAETDTGLTYNPSSGVLTSTQFTGAVSGNATTATALATGRTIGMTGDVVWTSASFDGSGNVTGSAVIQANSVALGTDTTGDYVGTITGGTGVASTAATSGEGTTHTLSIGQAVATTSDVTFGDVTVSGDLTVSGDTTTVNTSTLTVEDPLISMASGNNAADAVDIGIYGLYDTSGSQDLYGGLFRDANDSGKWKLFKDNQAAPTTTVNTSGTGYAVATLVANVEGNVTGDVTGDLTGNADTATLATSFTASANNSTDETVYPVFVDGATGTQGAETDTGLSYNPSSGILTTTSVTGNLTGNVTGNADTATTATTATNVTASANNSTDETVYPTFVDGATGGQGIETDTGLTYNPSSGNLTIGGSLTAASLDISGNTDVDGTMEADAYTVDGTALNEYIADTVGAMVSSNTESGITVAYEDGDNTLDFTVGTLNQNTTGTAASWTTARTLSFTGDVTGSGSVDGSGDVATALTIAANSVALGTDTTGNYMAQVAGGTGITVSHTQGEGSTATLTGTAIYNAAGSLLNG